MRSVHHLSLWDSTPNAWVEDELLMILRQSLKWKSMDILRWIINWFIVDIFVQFNSSQNFLFIFENNTIDGNRDLEKAIMNLQSGFYSPNIQTMKLNAPMRDIELFLWIQKKQINIYE